VYHPARIPRGGLAEGMSAHKKASNPEIDEGRSSGIDGIAEGVRPALGNGRRRLAGVPMLLALKSVNNGSSPGPPSR
jgi:hypothetical protein